MSSNAGMSDFEIMLRLAIINDIYTSSKRVLTRMKHLSKYASPQMQTTLNLIRYSKYPKWAIGVALMNYEVEPYG